MFLKISENYQTVGGGKEQEVKNDDCVPHDVFEHHRFVRYKISQQKHCKGYRRST
jgi:hypothetical protein